MGPLAAYSIKSAILLSILMVTYALTLRRMNYASLRRITLLCICAASLALPLLQFFSASRAPYVGVMSTPTQTSSVIDGGALPIIYTVIVWVVTAGIIASAIISLFGLARIMLLRSKTVYRNGQRIKVLKGSHQSPFCFSGYIYVSEEDFMELPEMVIAHENSHIRHLHFIDLIIGRITLILQWWNPFAWLLCKEMQRVHEYQADNDVISAGYDSKEYQYMLLSRSIGGSDIGLVNGLRHSELKKRLKMINRELSRKEKRLALLMAIPCALITLALPNIPAASIISNQISAISFASSLKKTKVIDVTKTDEHPVYFIDGTMISSEDIISIDPQAIESISVWKDQPEYPYGVIEIETKPGMSSHKPQDSPESEKVEEIKVIGYGIQKKNSN